MSAIKACLLKVSLIDLSDLPSEILTKALDEGTASASFQPWGWATRALLAYRGGDPQSAIKYLGKSEELTRDDRVHAFNLALLALSHHQLQHQSEARQALDEASQLITRLRKNASDNGDHDVLIAEILYREAEAKMAGKNVDSTVAEPESSTSPEKKPLPTGPADKNPTKKD
jgi:tetratricopeptide (TPR) repeat protein